MTSDNTTVIGSVHNYGSIKQHLLDVTEEIFDWAQEREIDLSAEYIQGALNVAADLASCASGFTKEWRLIPTKF